MCRILHIVIRKLSTLIVCWCCASAVCAQSDTIQNATELSLYLHAGKLIKIHGEYPENKISTLSEIHIGRKLNGKKAWHGTFSYPTAGISLVHVQFGNQDVLGSAIAVVPSMRFQKWKNNTRWSWRAGLGIAGFNKPYNAELNARNLVIGSRIANLTMFQVEMNKLLSKKIRYSLGISFTHSSNAHIAVPNIGANIISLFAGIHFTNTPALLRAKTNANTKKRLYEKWVPGVETGLGMHEFQGTVRPTSGPIYFTYNQSVFVNHRFVSNRIFSFGLQHVYYTSYKAYIDSQELFPIEISAENKSHQITLFMGYAWQYGRTDLFVQAGVCIYNPFIHELEKVWDLPKHGLLYQYTASKIGYRIHAYSCDNSSRHQIDPYFQLAVKTNGGTADFLEVAIGAAFGRTETTSNKH
jgi:hypothetical protein